MRGHWPPNSKAKAIRLDRAQFEFYWATWDTAFRTIEKLAKASSNFSKMSIIGYRATTMSDHTADDSVSERPLDKISTTQRNDLSRNSSTNSYNPAGNLSKTCQI